MLENLFCAAVAILAVWGASALIFTLLFSLIRPKTKERTVLLLLPDPASDAVEQVSFALSRFSVTGELRYTRIAVLCEPADERRETLISAFGKDPRVTVCSAEEFHTAFLRKVPSDGQQNR